MSARGPIPTSPSGGSKTEGAADGSRYEFRIWAASLAEIRTRLERLAGLQPAGSKQYGRETYIVSDATDDTNTKIRSGAIDIKVLLRTDGNLEQWNPYLKATFPIDPTLIANEIFPALRVEPSELRERLLTAEVFVNSVIKAHPRLTVVEVDKVRRRYALSGCAAEFVEVEIDGSTLHSVAVESISRRAVLDVVSELGIGDHPNINYVRQIKRIKSIV